MLLRKITPNWRTLCRNFEYPYRHFDSEIIGIPTPCRGEDAILYDSYDRLPVDDYVEDNDPPKRLRRYAKCTVAIQDHHNYNIYLHDHGVYNQSVIDSRGKPRHFAPIEEKVIINKYLTDLIGQTSVLSVLYHSHRNHFSEVSQTPIREIMVDVHQVRQMVYPGHESSNSPEGIHRDGADCIVSAFVLNRVNIMGGDSIIYNPHKKPVYRTTLKPGLGMFQEDRELYHHVTGIRSDGNFVGYRDIIGLDFTYVFK